MIAAAAPSSTAVVAGVVIPFYQREPGILRRAVESVLAQALPPGVSLRIVVVDDESPSPPERDLEGLEIAPPHTLELLRRPNGGPGAARNVALDHFRQAPPDIVAFIDSDDAWTPEHLARALLLLGADRDVYFADHSRVDRHERSYFQENAKTAAWLRGEADSPFERIAGQEDAYLIPKPRAFEAFIRDYLAQTSTVVFRFARCPGLRFDTALRTAGEDYLFWFGLADAARGICVSTRLDARCGSGVNVYESIVSWDHPRAASLFAYQLLLWRTVAARFPLSAHERRLVRDRQAEYEELFAWVWLRTLLKRRVLNLDLVRTLSKGSRMRAAALAPRLVAALARRALHRGRRPALG